MEKKNELGKAALVLLVALCALGAILLVVQMCQSREVETTFLSDAIILVMYLMVLSYALQGYKVPHGNVMRFTILAYAVLLSVLFSVFAPAAWLSPLYQISAILAGYTAGRLHKQKECTMVMLFVSVVLLGGALYGASRSGEWNLFHQPIIWICMMVAYLVRYDEHKQAGEAAGKRKSESSSTAAKK